jgi:hypothetical protein
MAPFDRADKGVSLPGIYEQLTADEYDILHEARPALIELRSVFAASTALSNEEAAWFAGSPNAEPRLLRLRRLAGTSGHEPAALERFQWLE